ncbi:RND family efflux transporter, MFP subunit [Sphingomonas sp. NFR04]|nr:RND family efflux transporter, MFP subunit [Sphingomonas sp. NFR04]
MNGSVPVSPNAASPARNGGTRSPLRDRVRAIWVALAFLLAAGAALYVFTLRPGDGPVAAGQSRAALTVTTATPRRTTWPVVVVAQGAIAPWEEASIGTQIGSYQLVEVRANVGDRVRRGQVLARLDAALLRAEEAQLLARNAQATANDRRARGLRGVGGISDQEALQYTTEAKTASALLAAKRLQLRYTDIRAPDDGVVTARSATTGAVVPAGQELFRIIRKDRLEWRGELGPADMRVARRGQAIRLALPGGGEARAKIRAFAPALEAASRLGTVYADILPGSPARAGMYANGTILVGEAAALVVPAECVVIRDGRSYVLLLSTPARRSDVALRAVATGRRQGDQVEITQGLAGTEHLVRRGAAFLDDGDVVDIAQAAKDRP